MRDPRDRENKYNKKFAKEKGLKRKLIEPFWPKVHLITATKVLSPLVMRFSDLV